MTLVTTTSDATSLPTAVEKKPGLWAEMQADLAFGVANDGGGKLGRFLTNRGFHALLAYRIAHRLRHTPLKVLGFLLTRGVQILYAIDIDPRASIAGGVIIYHGVGVVIGKGARIEPNVVLFHGVTLGIKRGRGRDGYPHIASHCVIGAGAKLLGPIQIGAHTAIGANCVLTRDIPAHSVVRVPAPDIVTRSSSAT